MTEIIKPEFKRKRLHKLRMVRSKPQLAMHPDFKDLKKGTPIVATMTVVALGLSCFFAFLRSKDR